METWSSRLAVCDGMPIPKPMSLVGMANSAYSRLSVGGIPLKLGGKS